MRKISNYNTAPIQLVNIRYKPAYNSFNSYSSVPNRRVGPNNPVDWIFLGKLINV